MSTPRLTHATVAVLEYLLSLPEGSVTWGRQICANVRSESGTVHPILRRFEETGWVTWYREEPLPAGIRERPLRKYYRLTEQGRSEVPALLDARDRKMGVKRGE